jgi:hypothetical protein
VRAEGVGTSDGDGETWKGVWPGDPDGVDALALGEGVPIEYELDCVTGLLWDAVGGPPGDPESIATARTPATMSATAATVSPATTGLLDSIATPLRCGELGAV